MPVTVPRAETGDAVLKVLTEGGETVGERAAAPAGGAGRCRSKLGPPPASLGTGASHTCNPVVAQARSEAPALLRHWRLLVGHSRLRREAKRGKG